MASPDSIVRRLLETDDSPDSLDAAGYVGDLIKAKESGEVNFFSAQTANHFWHRTQRNKRGAAVECRRNGATKTWKRQPGVFKIPVKYGLYNHFYITNDNASEWSTVPPT